MTTTPTGSERTFTLAELAELAGLPATVVRRWVERDLLQPRRGSTDAFPFRALGAARTLAQLWRAGWTAPRIQRAWQLARTVVGDADAALTGLLASIGRRRVTVRTPDGRLVEPGGQLLFDFGARPDSPALPSLRSAHDWFQAGVDAEAAGRLEDAVRAYEHALGSGNAEAHFNLGNCLYALRRRGDAAAQFEAAVAAAPDYAEAWNNLGIVRGELGDRDGSIAALRRSLALVPHYADAHYNLAEALAVAGEVDDARRHWRAYLSFDPNSRWADQVRRRLQAHGGERP
ncbi:MAG: tetratricopeptide repeat protein [Planctomycetes bacterium]|nr:tetratricopeptide repeat protein [Planctomycetota bacterium]